IFLFLYIYRHSPSTVLPYTTLFRSLGVGDRHVAGESGVEEVGVLWPDPGIVESGRHRMCLLDLAVGVLEHVGAGTVEDPGITCRSEEHTSELQSRENLVCRLLLEKK